MTLDAPVPPFRLATFLVSDPPTDVDGDVISIEEPVEQAGRGRVQSSDGLKHLSVRIAVGADKRTARFTPKPAGNLRRDGAAKLLRCTSADQMPGSLVRVEYPRSIFGVCEDFVNDDSAD